MAPGLPLSVPPMAILTRDLVAVIRRGFSLPWRGFHGAPHWARVRENGLRLVPLTGANQKVVELFAFLHDSQRRNDNSDTEHGHRAALFAAAMAEQGYIDLEPDELAELMTACQGHSDGLRDGSATVQTCWDADRLDLGRVGIKPSPHYLCTEAARDPAMIEWAYKRSLGQPRSRSPAPRHAPLEKARSLKVRFS